MPCNVLLQSGTPYAATPRPGSGALDTDALLRFDSLASPCSLSGPARPSEDEATEAAQRVIALEQELVEGLLGSAPPGSELTRAEQGHGEAGITGALEGHEGEGGGEALPPMLLDPEWGEGEGAGAGGRGGSQEEEDAAKEEEMGGSGSGGGLSDLEDEALDEGATPLKGDKAGLEPLPRSESFEQRILQGVCSA